MSSKNPGRSTIGQRLADWWFHRTSQKGYRIDGETQTADDLAFSALTKPRHIAMIMDGNGRWAKQRGLDRRYGHRMGAENLKRMTELCSDIGIEYLTVYAFSTENWKRSEEEVAALMQLFVEFFNRYDAELDNEDIRLRFIGDFSALPESVLETIRQSEISSAHRKRMQLIVAFNYGGRRELVHSVKQLAKAVQAGELSPEAIDEDRLQQGLYMPDVPDPDLIIRTGGEMRLSNFLLWEAAYAEFWSTPTLWPDVDRSTLYEALLDYNGRERRFGGVLTK